MKRYYLGVLFSDCSIIEFSNLLTFRQATRKRLQIIKAGNSETGAHVVCTTIAPRTDRSDAQKWLYEQCKEEMERQGR